MIDKVGILEIANELGISSEMVINSAKAMGFSVETASSVVTLEDAEEIANCIINGEVPRQSSLLNDTYEKEQKSLRVDLENNTSLSTNSELIEIISVEPPNNQNQRTDNVAEAVADDKVDKNDDQVKGKDMEENIQDSSLESKKKQLDQYHKKILADWDELKEAQKKFEAYKVTELQSLKEKLLDEEIKSHSKIEEERVKRRTELKEDFLLKLEKEYEGINSRLTELTTKELELGSSARDLDLRIKAFEAEKDRFESEKAKLLSLHQQELEEEKQAFINRLEEEKATMMQEANEKIQQLYKDRERKSTEREDNLIAREQAVKVKENEIDAKQQSLQAHGELLYAQAKDRVDAELKNNKDKVTHSQKVIDRLQEELEDLQDELEQFEKFEDRDLPAELDEKRHEVIRLGKSLEEALNTKNDLKRLIDKEAKEHETIRTRLYEENLQLKKFNEEVESLRSENTILQMKLREIDFFKSENDLLQKKLNELNQLFSQAKEKELRVEDIKRDPYSRRELEKELPVDDEIRWLDSIENNMKQFGVEYPRRLLYAFHTALKSSEFSPLTVLSGVSGTGKSELPKLYSHFGGFNFLAEAVQPTWDSPESMLGYYNTIENKFDSSNILKFILQTTQSHNEAQYGWKESMNMILLDEMNLAHIEMYFAEFLSKFELRRGSSSVDLNIKLGAGMNYPLPLDRNVLWIGTMNEDETTKALSDKVLDRSFSINFPRPDELKSRLSLKKLNEIKEFEYLHRDTWNKWITHTDLFKERGVDVIDPFKNIANQINAKLAMTGRAIGHRVWQSMEYYIQNHPLVISNINDQDELTRNIKLAFEEQLVQKIMPKLRGIETHGKDKEVLQEIKDILVQHDFAIAEDFELSMDNHYGQFIWNSANYLK